ncbi:MAG: DNA repair protein RecN [Rhodobacteraceae bacterium]|nr:DNA repair protein RecN [Paracoccaceae bacterium]
MLRHLNIHDMLIIDRLELGFQPGLNVLTGETGAGKSILLDSLGFVLGWRGRADLVRTGAGQGEVQAIFELSPEHPAHAVLAEAGLPDDGELILRRINTPEGRKAAWVNDQRVSGEVLRTLSDTLVELHGQRGDLELLDTRQHRAMLDAFGGLGAEKAAVTRAWTARQAAEHALALAEEAMAGMRTEEDFLRHAIDEVDALDPRPGEEEALDTQRRLMQGAERMRTELSRALAAMGPEGAEGNMGDAVRWLDGMATNAEGSLDGPLAALERALVELGEAQTGVARFSETLCFHPSALEETEERLFALRGLARKHSVAPDDLIPFADKMRQRLTAFDNSTNQTRTLQAALRASSADYQTCADALSRARTAAAKRLDAAMATELAPLKLERAAFSTRVGKTAPGPDGQDAVAFVVVTNPGTPAGPLNRIASGGEMSRFLLALKLCLTRKATGLTMIFDEIDRGVGGATADAVGKRLARLAAGEQVLVVTHSPQVAARGAHHWRVSKEVSGDVTTSTVLLLKAQARVDELARMLSGDTVTEAAREAARALLVQR